MNAPSRMFNFGNRIKGCLLGVLFTCSGAGNPLAWTDGSRGGGGGGGGEERGALCVWAVPRREVGGVGLSRGWGGEGRGGGSGKDRTAFPG